MFLRFFLLVLVLSLHSDVFAQAKYVLRDLRDEWMSFNDGRYEPVGAVPFKGLNTVYLHFDPFRDAGSFLEIVSAKPYYLFVNGKVCGEYEGRSLFKVDSLLRTVNNRAGWIAIHQDRINERDLSTQLRGKARPLAKDAHNAVRPYSHFRDFVVLAGLMIILLFLVVVRANPKLASDYFSLRSIFSSRDVDDSQASARLTSGSNVQFYILSSVLIGFYLLIVMQHLPPQYALPAQFESSTFWDIWWQWLKLSVIVFNALVLKIMIIFVLTRLFGMRGVARVHFFNWIRILLLLMGVATVVLFIFFIGRGDNTSYYEMFLATLVAVLIGWIIAAFFKLGGRSGHSMFHLFSYLCATEIIPLLITVKVLFQ